LSQYPIMIGRLQNKSQHDGVLALCC
jgi:hypothetical protein